MHLRAAGALTALGLDATEFPAAHYDVVLAALAAGRAQPLRMRSAALTDDALLHALEPGLDLQEVAARRARG